MESSLRHNLFASPETADYFDTILDRDAFFDWTDSKLRRGNANKDHILTLDLLQCAAGDGEGSLADRCWQFDARVHIGFQTHVCVGNFTANASRPRLRIEYIADVGHFSSKSSVGIGLDSDRSILSKTNSSEVLFIHFGLYPDMREVGNLKRHSSWFQNISGSGCNLD